MTTTPAPKAGQTVSVKGSEYLPQGPRTGWVRSVANDVYEVVLTDGITNYYDAWEIEATK